MCDMDHNRPGHPIRLAVVGLRNIGLSHVRKAMALTGVEVRLGIDRLAERRDAAAACGIRTGAELAEVLADPAIDGVILAVPTPAHAECATRCLEAGKHVLVEKPLAATAAECDRLIAVRDQCRRLLMVGMNQRFSSAVRRARNLLADGVIGDLRHVHTWWLRPSIGDGMWQGRGEWGFARGGGGGPLHDLGVHKLDLALHLLDYPAATLIDSTVETGIGSAHAGTQGRRYDVEDRGLLRLSLPHGARCDLDVGNFCPDIHREDQGVCIRGTRGALWLDHRGLVVQRANAAESEVIPVLNDGGPHSCVDHFVRVIRGDEALSPTAEQNRLLVSWLDTATASLAPASAQAAGT